MSLPCSLMSDAAPLPRPSPSLEGLSFKVSDDREDVRVVNMALDYRGDVTIRLHSGQQITGYVFDRQLAGAELCSIRMFVAGQTNPVMVHGSDMAQIDFTGQDTAFGRSWEDWAKKWNGNSGPT